MATSVGPRQLPQILLSRAQGNLEDFPSYCPCASFSSHPNVWNSWNNMLILFTPSNEIAVDLMCMGLLGDLLLPFLLLWNWDILLQFLETKIHSLPPLSLPLASLCIHVLIGSPTISAFNLWCFAFSWSLRGLLLSFLYMKKLTHHILFNTQWIRWTRVECRVEDKNAKRNLATLPRNYLVFSWFVLP